MFVLLPLFVSLWKPLVSFVTPIAMNYGLNTFNYNLSITVSYIQLPSDTNNYNKLRSTTINYDQIRTITFNYNRLQSITIKHHQLLTVRTLYTHPTSQQKAALIFCFYCGPKAKPIFQEYLHTLDRRPYSIGVGNPKKLVLKQSVSTSRGGVCV